MYIILEDSALLKKDGKYHTVKVVLVTCSGGKHVDYVAEDGTILKSEPYCRSKYSKVTV